MIRWWLLLAAVGVAASACSSGEGSLAGSPSCHAAGSGHRCAVVPGGGTDTGTAPANLGVVPAKAGLATLPDVTYPSEGINVSRRRPAVPGKLAADATSPGTVLAAFMAQGIASVVGSALRTQRPAIALRTITEMHPTVPGVRPHVPYTGWVVIYRHVRLVSYGPKPFPRNARGTFVAIMNAATGQWTNFFDY